MKKFNKILILSVAILLFVGILTACNENTKQDAIPTDPVSQTVTSNGGMAVQYGNYLYFINGYLGSDADNTFGSVKTGAICRVELVEKKNESVDFDYETFQVVVPKNIYGADTTYPGFYIVDGYIYYHTTSVDKNGDGDYKTDCGVLMRTSVDGSKTETVKEFDDNDTVFYVSGSKLVYEREDYLYSVSLSDLKKEEKLDDETIKEYKFVGNYLFYTTYNHAREINTSSDYLVYVYDMTNGTKTLVLSSDITNQGTNNKTLYSVTFTAIKETDKNLYLFYTKEDNAGGDYNGYYYLVLDKSNIQSGKEMRLSNETETTTYSDFYVLNQNGYILGYDSGTFTVFQNNTKVVKSTYDEKTESKYETITGISDVIGVYENDSEVYAYYTTSSVSIDDETATGFHYIKLFNKKDGAYTVAYENKKSLFYCVPDSSYTNYEIDNVYYYNKDGSVVKTCECIFYLNDSKDDIAYYAFLDRDGEECKKEFVGKILGTIEEDTLLDLVSSESSED